jgi:hypothetical protein
MCRLRRSGGGRSILERRSGLCDREAGLKRTAGERVSASAPTRGQRRYCFDGVELFGVELFGAEPFGVEPFGVEPFGVAFDAACFL